MIEVVADWTAITGIVVSGVVGPVTAATLAFFHQARAQRHEREMADLRELRTLLSEGTADLKQAEGMREVAAAAILTHGATVRERAPNVLGQVQESAQKLTLQSERLGLLVGEKHPVAVAHREAVDLLTTALRTLVVADIEDRDERRDEWIAIRDQEPMKAARARFAAAAHRLVGSRIEPT